MDSGQLTHGNTILTAFSAQYKIVPKATRACNEHMDCYTLHPTAKDFSRSTCFAIQYTVTQVDSTKAGLRTISKNNRIPNTHITHNHCLSGILGAIHHPILVAPFINLSINPPINPPKSSRTTSKTHVAALARRASDDVEATFHIISAAQHSDHLLQGVSYQSELLSELQDLTHLWYAGRQ